jgi:hypothetical protein
MRDSEQFASQLRSQVASTAGASGELRVEHYEVAGCALIQAPASAQLGWGQRQEQPPESGHSTAPLRLGGIA